jgi:hypothetical protein
LSGAAALSDSLKSSDLYNGSRSLNLSEIPFATELFRQSFPIESVGVVSAELSPSLVNAQRAAVNYSEIGCRSDYVTVSSSVGRSSYLGGPYRLFESVIEGSMELISSAVFSFSGEFSRSRGLTESNVKNRSVRLFESDICNAKHSFWSAGIGQTRQLLPSLDFIPGGTNAGGGVGVGTYLGAILGAFAFIVLAITAVLSVRRAIKKVSDDGGAELDTVNAIVVNDQVTSDFATQFAPTSGGFGDFRWTTEAFDDFADVFQSDADEMPLWR